jgi:pyruvate dehydrogenase E1 component beta subunit
MTGANIGSTTYVEAILAAQRKILMEKSNSLVLGINVTSPSAIFGSVKGLYEEFGDKRVIETPSSENAVTGIALGLATSGHIPILVHQRLDFAILSFDMLINQLAKWQFMYGDNLSAPVIVRMIVGRGWGQGPQHSQALHNLFMHVPGFRVFSHSSPQDIYS